MLAFALLLGACERHGPGAPAGSVAELELGLARTGRVEIFVRDAGLAAIADVGARTLAARSGFEVERVPAGEPGTGRGARFVIGTFDEPEVRALLTPLGIEPWADDPSRFLYRGMLLGEAGDLLAASFQDPLRPGLPVALLAGGRPEALQPLLEDLSFPPRPAARVYTAGELQLEVLLRLDGAARSATARDRSDERRVLRRDHNLVGSADASLRARHVAGVPVWRARGYLAEVTRAREALRSWSGVVGELPPLPLTLVSEPAEMLALSERVALSAPSGLHGGIIALLYRGVPDDAGAGAARETLLAVLGPAAEVWMLDGAAIDAAGAWWGRPLQGGGALRVLPPIAELIDPAALDRHSMHILAPARGLLFRFLRERLGGEAMRAAWRGEAALALDGLDAELAAFAGTRDEAAPLGTAPFTAGATWRGLAVDSRITPGGALANLELAPALEHAAEVGADALSITSYAIARPCAPPAPGGRLAPGLESVEGDAVLAVAIAEARRRGLARVVLQPHVLGEESGGHLAWRRRTERADWDEFFAAFQPWLLHYAALAELTGCDVLCIGTDILPPTERTGIEPDVRAHFARLWSEAIAAARAVYSGALTYAARWPEEARVVPFWGELDAIGFTLYPHLTGDRAPRGAAQTLQMLALQFESRLDELASFAAERGRPALILELGFRSTRSATRESELGPGASDMEEQARAYAALTRALAVVCRDRPDLAGLFLWKWEIEPLADPGAARSFSPRHKPAEAVLRAMYRAE